MASTRAIVLVYALVGFAAEAGAQTGNPYYPLQSGNSITYRVFDITGTWNSATKELSISTRVDSTQLSNPTTISYGTNTCPTFFGSGPLFTESYNGTTPLQEGGGSVGGISYIGEAINQLGQVMVPFEAKLTSVPVAGEVIPPTQTITYSRNDVCSNPPASATQTYGYWTYRTIAHYPNWGVFSDVWRTGLHECGVVANCTPTAGQSVYNYAFKRNVGMIDFWFGTLGADGSTVTGHEYYSQQYQY